MCLSAEHGSLKMDHPFCADTNPVDNQTEQQNIKGIAMESVSHRSAAKYAYNGTKECRELDHTISYQPLLT